MSNNAAAVVNCRALWTKPNNNSGYPPFDAKGTIKMLFHTSRQKYLSILSLGATLTPLRSANKEHASAKYQK